MKWGSKVGKMLNPKGGEMVMQLKVTGRATAQRDERASCVGEAGRQWSPHG